MEPDFAKLYEDYYADVPHGVCRCAACEDFTMTALRQAYAAGQRQMREAAAEASWGVHPDESVPAIIRALPVIGEG